MGATLFVAAWVFAGNAAVAMTTTTTDFPDMATCNTAAAASRAVAIAPYKNIAWCVAK